MTRNETIEQHYRQNYKTLVKRAVWRVPNRSQHIAEEVVQEAYARALRFWEGFNPDRSDFGAWMNRIFKGCIADCIRSENGITHPSLDDEDEYLEPFVIDNSNWIPQGIVVKIKEAIEAQKPENAEVLTLFFIVGMKTIDIAECTNLTHSNIRQIIRRFRIKWEGENIF